MLKPLVPALLLLAPATVWAAESVNSGGIAITFFIVFVAATLAITWWAARRTHTTHDFYAAGGNISGLQNGLAIAGDFMSAASFLGVTGLIFGFGFYNFSHPKPSSFNSDENETPQTIRNRHVRQRANAGALQTI